MVTKEDLRNDIENLPKGRIPGAFDIEEETAYLAEVVNKLCND